MANEWYYREKARRGQEFLAERAAAKAEWRAEGNDRHRKRARNLKARLCHGARVRARKIGMEATISPKDLHWPEFCPVLGLKLDYDTPKGQRDSQNPALPSLDRWDNCVGYVPGNVHVISLRANLLKSNATADELEKISVYCRHGIW